METSRTNFRSRGPRGHTRICDNTILPFPDVQKGYHPASSTRAWDTLFHDFFPPDNHTVHHGNILKSLLFGHFGKFRIQVMPLVILTLRGLNQITGRVQNNPGRIRGSDLQHSSFQTTEETFRVHLFLQSGLVEYARYSFVPLFFFATSEKKYTDFLPVILRQMILKDWPLLKVFYTFVHSFSFFLREKDVLSYVI